MKINKRLWVVVTLAAVAVIGTAATSTSPVKPANDYTNLKVLPKDISSKDLQEIMTDDFEDGLGVSCGFCHANAADGHGLDFASDAKPEKGRAREMVSMTAEANEHYLDRKSVV